MYLSICTYSIRHIMISEQKWLVVNIINEVLVLDLQEQQRPCFPNPINIFRQRFTVRRFTEVLQSPHMLPVILYILQNRESEKDKDNSERMRGRQLWGLDRDNTTMTTVMKNTTANYIKGILESCWDNAELERKGICFEKCWICIFTNLDVMQNKSGTRPLVQPKLHLKLVEDSI